MKSPLLLISIRTRAIAQRNVIKLYFKRYIRLSLCQDMSEVTFPLLLRRTVLAN